MAMRLIATASVRASDAAVGAASGGATLAVQGLAGVDLTGHDLVFGSILAAVVAAFTAVVTAGIRERRQSNDERQQLAAELAAARQRITELEHRVDELTAMLLGRT